MSWRAIALSVCVCSSAVAADADGLINMRGIGSAPCPEVVRAHDDARRVTGYTMRAAKGNNLETSLYVAPYSEWVNGWASGASAQTSGVYDVYAGLSHVEVDAWIEKYCRGHPLDSLVNAAVALQKHVEQRPAPKAGTPLALQKPLEQRAARGD